MTCTAVNNVEDQEEPVSVTKICSEHKTMYTVEDQQARIGTNKAASCYLDGK